MAWSPRLMDLTRPMTQETIIELAGKLVADEDSPYREVKVSWLRNWETDNGTLCQWTLNDHFGTHLDAPIHIVPNAPSVDQVDINRLIGVAVVIDCSVANGRGLTSEDFERAKPEVQQGDIVLIYSAERSAGTLDDFIRKGLANLERIVGRRVHFSALPLPVPQSSGSPVRAVAWEE